MRILLALAIWVFVLTVLWVASVYYLFYEDQGRGFGLMTAAIILQLGVGWKMRWWQARRQRPTASP